MELFFEHIWSASPFMPHGHCYLWDAGILWFNVISDAIIAVTYFVIPFFLIYLMRRRRDLDSKWILPMFAAFVVACGMTHLFEIWTVWNAHYALQGLVKSLAALVSVVAVIGLWLLIPSILAIPSLTQQQTLIDQLKREIAERKRAEVSLRNSEDRFRVMVESVRDYAIYMIDPHGIVTTWNKGAEQIKGYTSEEIIGQNYSRFFCAEDLTRNLPEKVMATARERGRYETEGLRIRKDGSKFWADVIVTPLYDTKKQLMGYAKVTRDITERKEAEDALRLLNNELEARVQSRTKEVQLREARLIAITNAIPVLIAEIDSEERLLFANDLFHKWVLMDPDQFVGKQLKDFLEISRYAEIRDYLEEARNGRPVSLIRELHTEQTRIFMQVNYIPEFDANKKVFAVILVASDITKHILAEEELKLAKVSAEGANLAKSAFLANMSHEIRTPLGAVLGYSELIVRPNLSEVERNDFAAAIRRNVDFLSQIINDILDLSKIEAGKLVINIRDVEIEEVFKDLSTLLKLQADEKNIELKVESHELLPTHIQTDPLKLKQILLNIVGNAIKFTEHGTVWVTIKFIKGEQDRQQMVFIVEDTGIGITKENVLKLFAPFSQADVSYKRKYGGTGLGLVLSKHLANLLGGDVVLVHSKVGQGSVFSISIDPGIVLNEKPKRGDAKSKHKQETIQGFVPKNGKKPLEGIHALVIDDSPDNYALVSHYLRGSGAAVDTAENGAEALEKVQNNNYDVLFMDLQMPVMDGFEATKALRNAGYTVPIIALTAHAFDENRQKCLESGFTDFLSKPIDSKLLLKRLILLFKIAPPNGMRDVGE